MKNMGHLQKRNGPGGGPQKQGLPSPDLWRPTKLALKCLYFRDNVHMGSCDRCPASLAASQP